MARRNGEGDTVARCSEVEELLAVGLGSPLTLGSPFSLGALEDWSDLALAVDDAALATPQRALTTAARG